MKVKKNNITIYSSNDGYDEVSSKEKTECVNIHNGNCTSFTIDPSQFFKPFDMPAVKDRDDARNLFISGLSGKDENVADIFAINTALALKTIDNIELDKGYVICRKHIDAGEAKDKLDRMISG
jgi:anthranilate phosphoribosyltransferase